MMIDALRRVIKRPHYPLEVMLVGVGWYAAYPLSLRHIGVVVLSVNLWTRRPLQVLLSEGKWSARMYSACLMGTASCPQPR